jgi:hypothetical protein
MSTNVPPLMLGEETSRTPPSRPSSVSNLLRRLICFVAELMKNGLVVRILSLVPAWSSIKAALGAESGVVVEVTH